MIGSKGALFEKTEGAASMDLFPSAEKRVSIEDLVERLRAAPRGRRSLVAIAGAPASGKSYLAADLTGRLNREDPSRAAALGMDGFHYDDGLLRALGRLARKGAPDTFDVGGLAALLGRLRENAEEAIAVPVFDRAVEIARAGAALIPRRVEILLVEGNYLLADVPPWDRLAPLFDLRLFIEASEALRRARLSERWRGRDAAEVRARIEGNDLPNGRFVVERSRGADLILSADAGRARGPFD